MSQRTPDLIQLKDRLPMPNGPVVGRANTPPSSIDGHFKYHKVCHRPGIREKFSGAVNDLAATDLALLLDTTNDSARSLVPHCTCCLLRLRPPSLVRTGNTCWRRRSATRSCLSRCSFVGGLRSTRRRPRSTGCTAVRSDNPLNPPCGGTRSSSRTQAPMTVAATLVKPPTA